MGRPPPEPEVLACLEGLLDRRPESVPHNFEDWILQKFGQGLAQAFMLPYNRKCWACEPADMSWGWVGERVAEVDLKRVLRNLVMRQVEAVWGPNASFRYPLRGGTGGIWRALWSRLPDSHKGKARVQAIRGDRREALLQCGRVVSYDHLISTQPLDGLLGLLEDRPELNALSGDLRYSSTHVVGVGLAGSPPNHLQSRNWVYFPEADVPFYRVTVFSNYSPYNVPEPGRQWSLLCEVSSSPTSPPPADVPGAVLEGLRRVGFIGDQVPISVFERFLPRGYPVPFLGRDALLQRAQTALNALDSQIPESDLACFANTFEGSSVFRSPLPFLTSRARFSGYRVDQGGGVEDLRNLKSLGALYMDAHGASSDEASSNDGQTSSRGLVLRERVPRSFSVWTQTQANQDLDDRYEAELRSQTLIHFIAPIDNEHYERRYGITPKFVRENWTFRSHSLVFMNACSSNAADFREACLEVGASAYIGWTLSVYDTVAYDAAEALYTFLFPSSNDPPVFTLEEAFAKLANLGLDLDSNTQARLKLTQTPSFGLLVPSLRSLTVSEDQIVLRGFFGSQPGQVLVDGSPVPLVGDWDPQVLSLALPETGTHLRVQVLGRLSNTLEIPRSEGAGPVGNVSFTGVGSITAITSGPRPDLVGSPMNISLTIQDGQVVAGVIDFGPPAGFTHSFVDQPGDVGPGVVNTLSNSTLNSKRGGRTITIPLPQPDQATASGQFHSIVSGEGTGFDIKGDFVYQITSFSQ